MSPRERRGPVLDALSVTVSKRARALDVLVREYFTKADATDATDAAHTA
jgi:hypothetical protein